MILTALWVLALVLVILMIICLVRLILGPTVPDRVVSLDTINTLAIAELVILGVILKQIIFIDVALVYTLLAFVSTLCIAKYLEGGA